MPVLKNLGLLGKRLARRVRRALGFASSTTTVGERTFVALVEDPADEKKASRTERTT